MVYLTSCKRTGRFLLKSSGYLFKRKIFLVFAAEAPHGNRTVRRFLGTDNQDHRHFGNAVLANLVIYFFVPDIQFRLQPRLDQSRMDLPGIIVGVVGDGGDDDLKRRQLERKFSRVVFD